MAHQKFDYQQKSRRNGIYSSVALEKLKNLLEKDKYTTDFFNILLNQDVNKTELAIVSPTKFYKLFKELGEEPRVPNDITNENNIISFYKDNFAKYDGVSYNEKTFVADKKFPEFETEVFLASTLNNTYQDFNKPYTSIEFFANLKKSPQNNLVQSYISIPKDERIKFLKRFVKDKQELGNGSGVGVVKDYSLKKKEIYTSKTDLNPTLVGDLSGVTSKESNFERKIPLGGVLGVPAPIAFTKSTQIQNINDIKNEKYCSYDVLGYVITKKRGDKIIKRVYVLNDEDNFSGYLKYFDSQIKEDVSYSYNVEQINLIHGKQIEVETLTFPSNDPAEQKEFIKQQNPSIEQIFGPLFSNESPNFANAEDNKSLPFYKNQDFQIKISSTTKDAKLVAYSPILSEDLDSPDLTLNTKVFQIKPSQPDIKIFSKKGESKSVLLLLSSLIGERRKVTLLEEVSKTNVKLIDLGFDVESLFFPVKEFRVYRTEDAPSSYSSFPSKPRKIVNPDNPDFIDSIEPNTKYYYYAESIDIKGTKSDPTKVLKLEIIEEQGHIFSLLEVYEFGQEKESIKEKMFRRQLKVSPTFLQSAIKDMVVGGYINEDNKDDYANALFEKSENVLVNTLKPSHKLRVTSKKTRRRFDINVIYSYKEVKNFEEIPPNAELVLEEEIPLGVAAPVVDTTSPLGTISPKVASPTASTSSPSPAPAPPKTAVEVETNPCCKSKDFSIKKSGGPISSGDETELIQFQQNMITAISAVDGLGTDEDKLEKVMNSLTDADKCFLCRRLYWGEGKSLYARFEEDLNDKEKKQILYNKIKCTKFGYTSDRGNVKGSSINAETSVDILIKGKCKN